MYNWFKFYGQDFLSDLKISQLSIAERLFWVTVLCLAHAEGKAGNIRYCTEELIKSKMGLQENDQEWIELNGVFDVLQNLEMIEKTDNGIFVKNFQKRQEMNLIPAEKMRRYRNKKESNKSYRKEVTDVIQTRIDKNRLDKNRIEKKIQSLMSDSDFQEFWFIYPRKIAKQDAIKAFRKVPPAKLSEILKAVEAQKQSKQWLKDNGAFIPHPATWLNGERWNDEVPVLTKEQEAIQLVEQCKKEFGEEHGNEIAFEKFRKKYYPTPNDQGILEYINLFKL